MLLPLLSLAQISVGISVNIAPPELPVYVQPPIPADGYLWTPGYWAWGDDIQDYYWVPGTWVEPPQVGFLWTPGYWGWANGLYLWNAGYWGPHVGFYGGVNYGYGYGGHGYEGGYWQGNHLYYNRAVVNVGSVHVTNVYNKTVINNVEVTRVSYTGGSGGVRANPLQRNRRRRMSITSRSPQRSSSMCRRRAATRRCAPAPTEAIRRLPPPRGRGEFFRPWRGSGKAYGNQQRGARIQTRTRSRRAQRPRRALRRSLVQPCSPGHLRSRERPRPASL